MNNNKGFKIKKNKNPLENFPSVYYISLEESVDRRNNLIEQFKKYNVTNLNGIISKRYKDSNDKVTGKYLHQLTEGAIGCVVSHLKALKQWYYNTDEDYAFFCEDDVSLETVEYWNFTWEEFIETIPEDAEFVQLMVISETFDNFQLHERKWDEWAASAYIVTREYAKKIIDTYCISDTYNLNNPIYDVIPIVENILCAGLGKVYSIPLLVEDIKFNSTFSEEQEPDVKNGHKTKHLSSHHTVLSYWKNKRKYDKNELEKLLTEYTLDTENPEINFSLGLWYENNNHISPATSFYLRCAERSEDKNLAYEALIRCYFCYDKQGLRTVTSRGLLYNAQTLLPDRPEVYYLMNLIAEKNYWWQDCYINAEMALRHCKFDYPPLRIDIGYPGKYVLLFQKALSGWWWGKTEESGNLFKMLLDSYEMNDYYREAVLNNLKTYFKHLLLVPENFDWGETDPEYIELFKNENFIERVYEKHYSIKNGDIVFDIGANCGSFTYSILHKNPKHVYCIEPSNTIINSLRKNVSHGPVTLINKAISDVEDENKVISASGVYLYHHKGNTYSTTTFKKIIEQYGISKIDFLKFDCEGGEYSIFTEENYEYISNNIKNFAGEWHINDHENSVEKFIIFRDLYLKNCSNLHVYERTGKDVTSDIYNNQYLYNFRDYWKSTYLGQFIVYFSYDV